jgi:hypothetical protein
VTLPTADVLGRRLTLSYVPATDEDAALAKSYGGIARTPPYLIEVRPVIKTGGVEVAVGSGPVGMGVRFTFRIELRSPGGTQVVTNSVIAGNLTAIGLGGREVTATEADQDQAAQILSRLAWTYLDKWNQSDAELSRLLRVVPVRPTVSTCLVMSDIQVDYAGGDPLYPITFDWRGLAIDADHRATAPVGLESVAQEKSFLLMSGLEGSVLEHRIFEEELAVASVSTAKGLGLAHAQGIEIADLTSSNAEAILPTLPFDLAVKDDIRQATARGLLARVPTAPLVAVSWRGVPYLLLDEETGEAAYQLQGGRSGGVTVATVIDFPAVLKDTLDLQGETPAPETSDVARIQKFGTTDFQEDTVNQRLGRPFKVLVTDRDGFPVRNARVTFSIMGGGGVLEDPCHWHHASDRARRLVRHAGRGAGPAHPGQAHRRHPTVRAARGRRVLHPGRREPGDGARGQRDPGRAFHGHRVPRRPGPHRNPQGDDRAPQRPLRGRPLQPEGGRPHRRERPRSVRQPALELADHIYGSRTGRPRHAARGPEPVRRSDDDARLRAQGADYVECIKRFVNPGWGDCTGEGLARHREVFEPGCLRLCRGRRQHVQLYFFDIQSGLTDRLSVWYGTWGHSATARTPSGLPRRLAARTCSWPRAAAPCASTGWATTSRPIRSAATRRPSSGRTSCWRRSASSGRWTGRVGSTTTRSAPISGGASGSPIRSSTCAR